MVMVLTKSPTRSFLKKFDTDKLILIEKFNPEKIVSAVYLDKEKLQFNVKRFKIETTTLGTKFAFIKEGEGNYLEAVSTNEEPILVVQSGRGSQVRKAKFKIAKTAEITGWKTVGTKLVDFTKTMTMEWQKSKEDKQGELFE
jgi:topoisomerase-4 subunit A